MNMLTPTGSKVTDLRLAIGCMLRLAGLLGVLAM